MKWARVVGGGDADEGGAGVGVEVRGALAEEVGCPEQAVAAGRDAWRRAAVRSS